MKATAVIIKKDNRILLSKRSPNLSEEPNKWENVGGSVDEGETFEVAARREINEELGVEIRQLETALEYKNDKGEIYCTVFFAQIDSTPKIMEPEACSELKWFEIENLKGVDLANYTRKDFEKLEWL